MKQHLIHRWRLSGAWSFQGLLLSALIALIALTFFGRCSVYSQEQLSDQEIYDRVAKILPTLEKSESLDLREKGYLKAYERLNQAERPDLIQLLRVTNGVVESYGEHQDLAGIQSAALNLADKIDVSNVDELSSAQVIELYIHTARLSDRLQALHRYELVESYLAKLNAHIDNRFFEDMPFEQTSTPSLFLWMQGLNELYSQSWDDCLQSFERSQVSMEKYMRYAFENNPAWRKVVTRIQEEREAFKAELEIAKERLTPEQLQEILADDEDDDFDSYEELRIQTNKLCYFGFLSLMAQCGREQTEPDLDEAADLAKLVIGENLMMFIQAYGTLENIASDRGELGVLQPLSEVFEAVPLIKDSRGLKIKKISAQTAEALPELSEGDRIVALNSWRQFDADALNNFAWAKRAVGSHDKFTLQVVSKEDGQVHEYPIDPFQLKLTLEP